MGCIAITWRDTLSRPLTLHQNRNGSGGCRPAGKVLTEQAASNDAGNQRSVFMPIQVTCANCLKRFQVSDKFAGKSGACPNCKKPIKVPDASEQVVIHAPDDGAPKDREGKSVLKPLTREETDVTRKGLLITGGAILAALGVAIGFRATSGGEGAPLWAQIIGLISLAPPLIWAGYTFVREQELEAYTGAELRNRVLLLSAIFAALWLIYAFAPAYVLELDSASQMSFMVFGITFAVMLGVGALASAGTFELEFLSGLALAGLYLIATMVLALIAGVPLASSGAG